MRLILGSASPRRADLLAAAGYVFETEASDTDEAVVPGELPLDYVRRVALAKSQAFVAACPDCALLTADTTVAVDEQILGKPADADEARWMLGRLSGREHLVHTAVAVRVCGDAHVHLDVATTRVRFLHLSSADIAWYVGSGEPEGKAGGYAIQGRAARFIDWIEGSYSNVVGLPLHLVHQLLSRIGYEPAG